LLYVDDSKGSTFIYIEKLRAKAQCVNLNGKELLFTIWEDDAKNSGHNPTNKAIETKKVKVDRYGVATAEFMLTRAFMEKAMRGEADSKQLEFYVTVEYYKGKIHDSENVEIKNPRATPSPIGTKPPEKKRAIKAKGSPAEQKPASKKEEKGIWDNFKDYLHDWAEAKGTVTKEKEPTQAKNESVSTSGVGKKAPTKQNDKCVCKEQYKDLIWGEKVSCEFRKKVIEISKELWAGDYNNMANNLMAIIALETNKSFNPKSSNKNGYFGLIGFGNPVIEDFQRTLDKSITKEKVLNSSAVEQLYYVKERFKFVQKHLMNNGKGGVLSDFTDLYLAVLYPSKSGLSNGEDAKQKIIFDASKGLKYELEYRQNPSFMKEIGEWANKVDVTFTRKDKKVTETLRGYKDLSKAKTYRWEVTEEIINYKNEGEKYKAKSFSCQESKKEEPKKENKGKWHDPVNKPQLRGWYSTWAPERSIHSNNIPGRSKGKHDGLDLYAPIGTTIYACIDGEVNEIYSSASYGNCINIKGKYNGKIYWFFYAHLSEIFIKAKDTSGNPTQVKAGDIIGKSGKTGSSAAGLKPNQVHLHYEVRTTKERTGGRVNPFTHISELNVNVNKNPNKENQP